MPQFLFSSIDGPCPVCSRNHDKDCRWTQDSGLVLCWTKARGGTSTVAVPPDEVQAGDDALYKTIGLSDDGKWMKYKLQEKPWQKPARPPEKKHFDYFDRLSGQLICRVTRTDKAGGKKDFSQLYRNTANGEWEKYTQEKGKWASSFSKPLKEGLMGQLLPYGWKACEEAITNKKPILVVEGEGKVDYLRGKGIDAISFIGGAGKYRYYGYPGYKELLQGLFLILCPDRDLLGVSHMEDVATDFPNAPWLYVEPTSREWQNLPKDKGFDIADWQCTKEEILGAVEVRRKPSTQKEAPKPAAVKLSGEALLTKIDGLLDMEVSGSRLSAFISDLATQSGRQPRDIRDLFSQRQQERDLAETVDDRKANIDTWMKLKERKIHLKDFLHPDFATPLAAVYDQMHVPQAVALYTILPVMLSLCKIGTRLAVIPATNFYALPILYTGIVGESGSGKSPAMKIIMSALDELQAEAHEEYEAAMEQFDESLEEWTNGDRKNRGKKPKPPVERQYFVKDFTPESVAMIQSQQPDRGLLNYQDELSTIVTSRGKYSNGKGSDKENMLSGKDGSGIKVNRASGKSIYVKSTSVSIVGSTQPDTLKAMMGDFSDGAGEWARFLWTMIPLQSRPKPKNPVKYDISELLKAFFVEISNLPAETYVMSPEADRLYSEFHDQLDKRRQDEPRQAMRAVYSKMQGDVAIVMLAFHLINSLAAGNTPTIQVGAEAAARAIAFAKDAINNVRQIHLLGDDGKKDVSPLDMMQRIITLSERKGWLDASTAKQGIWKCQLSTVEIRTLFHEMANDFGIGQLRGEGKSMQWCVGTTETQSENMEATAVPPVVSEPESPPPEPSPPPEIEQVSEPLPEPELVSVQESVAVAVTQTEQRPKSEPVTSKLEQLRDALDPSLPLTVESITRKKDGAVFRVGDLIQIAIDHMDEIDQRDVLKHDGTPVGAITRIEKFELNDAGLFMKRAIYAPHMRVNGRTVSVPETYLRHVQQE